MEQIDLNTLSNEADRQIAINSTLEALTGKLTELRGWQPEMFAEKEALRPMAMKADLADRAIRAYVAGEKGATFEQAVLAIQKWGEACLAKYKEALYGERVKQGGFPF
jgi:hypothetical protein